MYSDSYKFVYLPMPKTGTSSICDILEKNYDAKIYPNQYGGRHIMTIPSWCKSYLTFTTIRSPLDRMFSIKKHLETWNGIKCNNFNKFMDDIMLPRKYWLCKNQSECLRGINVDFTLKLENISKEFNKLPFVESKHIIPHINKNMMNIKIPKNCVRYSMLWASDDFANFNYNCHTML